LIRGHITYHTSHPDCGTNLIGGGGNCGHPFFEANFVVFNWAGPFVGIAPHA